MVPLQLCFVVSLSCCKGCRGRSGSQSWRRVLCGCTLSFPCTRAVACDGRNTQKWCTLNSAAAGSQTSFCDQEATGVCIQRIQASDDCYIYINVYINITLIIHHMHAQSSVYSLSIYRNVPKRSPYSMYYYSCTHAWVPECYTVQTAWLYCMHSIQFIVKLTTRVKFLLLSLLFWLHSKDEQFPLALVLPFDSL